MTKTTVLYKGHFVEGCKVSVSSCYYKDEKYTKHLINEGLSDLVLPENAFIYVPSATREKGEGGKSIAGAKICSLLEIFRNEGNPKAKDLKDFLFVGRITRNQALLAQLCENRSEVLVRFGRRPTEHGESVPSIRVETLAQAG